MAVAARRQVVTGRRHSGLLTPICSDLPFSRGEVEPVEPRRGAAEKVRFFRVKSCVDYLTMAADFGGVSTSFAHALTRSFSG
jgi:hypothetical protein